MARRQYDDATKAAVMAALLAGQSSGEVATEYNIPEGTIRGWAARKTPVVSVDHKKEAEIGELLLGYLRTNLVALEAQAQVFADEKWLRQQPASEAAVLHGVMTDKAIRLLEAFGKADDNNTDAAN